MWIDISFCDKHADKTCCLIVCFVTSLFPAVIHVMNIKYETIICPLKSWNSNNHNVLLFSVTYNSHLRDMTSSIIVTKISLNDVVMILL